MVVFRNIDLTSIAWSVGIYNLGTMNLGTMADRVVILCRPENASSQGFRRGFQPDITSLPAEITLYARRPSLGEQMQYLFLGP